MSITTIFDRIAVIGLTTVAMATPTLIGFWVFVGGFSIHSNFVYADEQTMFDGQITIWDWDASDKLAWQAPENGTGEIYVMGPSDAFPEYTINLTTNHEGKKNFKETTTSLVVWWNGSVEFANI